MPPRRFVSFEPEPDHRDHLPWYRRAVDWAKKFHNFVSVLAAFSASTIVVHAWMGGLVTRTEVKAEVDAAVERKLVLILSQMQADIVTIKNSTNDLPAWRGDMTNRMTRVETVADKNGDLARTVTERVDRYLISRAR